MFLTSAQCDLRRLTKDSDREPSQTGSPESGRLNRFRPNHRAIQKISLKLHEQIVGRSSAVDPQLFEMDAGVGFHRPEDIGDLVRDRFDRGSRTMLACNVE